MGALRLPMTIQVPQTPFELRVSTSDPIEQQICESYWSVTPQGSFREPIAQVARRFGITSQKVNGIVERGCVAVYQRLTCLRCGKPTAIFKRRYEAESIGYYKYADPGRFDYCPGCKLEAEREERESRAQAKLESMRRAFEGSRHQSLDPLEYNFLIEIASSVTISTAQQRVGVSTRDAKKILEKLDSLDLIDWSEDDLKRPFDPIKMLDELRGMLKGEQHRRRVKSIFGSPMAQEVFRKLKSQHPFVYPEIPLCAFIEKSDVEHLFQQGDLGYFLNCRVDFLICELDGTPVSAVEYQGGYHNDPQQAKRDDFKRKILSAVGLSLTTINSGDLKRSDALP
jgi:hypothetical protein